MNIFLAARAFAPHFKQLSDATPLSDRRMRYAITMAMLCPLVRGFPYLFWTLDHAHFTDWLVPVCVVPRLISIVVYALHNMAHAQACKNVHASCKSHKSTQQMYNMVMLYQYTMGIPIDMLTNLLVSSIVKEVPFAVHAPLALLEGVTVAYALASQFGMCGSLIALAGATPCSPKHVSSRHA